MTQLNRVQLASQNHDRRVERAVRNIMNKDPLISLQGISRQMGGVGWGGAISRYYNRVRRERSGKI